MNLKKTNKQNSRLLWKALKKLSPSGKVKLMPNDLKASRGGVAGLAIKQISLTIISSL